MIPTLLAAVLTVLTALALRAAVAATRAAAVRNRLDGANGRPSVADVFPDPPPSVALRLEDAGIDMSARAAFWGWIGTGTLATTAALVVGGPAIATVVAAGTAAVPLVGLRTRRGQGAVRLERGLPAALEAVARSLRSGASLRQAIAEAGDATPGPLGRELADVARQAAQGASLMSALKALALRRPSPGVRLTVAALCLGVKRAAPRHGRWTAWPRRSETGSACQPRYGPCRRRRACRRW